MSTRAALEAAIIADTTDDVAVHAAYADLLIEEGDPRGEYIRLQLLLEDRNQPVTVLREVEQRSFELRRQWEPTWLGDLYPFVHPPENPQSVGAMVVELVDLTWHRGWIDDLWVRWPRADIRTALTGLPLLRKLRTLRIGTEAWNPEAPQLLDWLDTPLFDRLETFVCSSYGFGFHGVDRLLSTGRLEFLRRLILNYCNLTDDAAERLAGWLEHHRLDHLDVRYNHLTGIGIQALASHGYAVDAESQFPEVPPLDTDDSDDE